MNVMSENKPAAAPARTRRRFPTELSIFLVLIGIGLVFELFGWIVRDQSFLMNSQRLVLMILQVSIIGLLAIGLLLRIHHELTVDAKPVNRRRRSKR